MANAAASPPSENAPAVEYIRFTLRLTANTKRSFEWEEFVARQNQERRGRRGPTGNVDDYYENILALIRNTARAFETTPGVYAPLGEEQLRDPILGPLNSHYPGRASEETFRKKGKTDIRIEGDDGIALVAECKIWDGGSKLGPLGERLSTTGPTRFRPDAPNQIRGERRNWSDPLSDTSRS